MKSSASEPGLRCLSKQEDKKYKHQYVDLCHLNTGAIILWYNGSYTMMAKPITALDLHYPMIQFLMKINVYTCTSVQWIANKNLLQFGNTAFCRERETEELTKKL